MKLLLAPMEGLIDHRMRDVLTRAGGVDHCVSEFIRVTDQLLPARVFLRLMPELAHGSRTAAGTPVRAQLLGSDAACLADNAARLAALGAEGIDLNFGCPAPTVNRHRGGAVLLDEPDLVHAIVAAVRRAVPASLPVSAKMRLGHRDESLMLDTARAIAAAGACELVVHARTKLHGYRPPAYWERIADIREAVAIEVIANGEIWTVDDARRCREQSSPEPNQSFPFLMPLILRPSGFWPLPLVVLCAMANHEPPSFFVARSDSMLNRDTSPVLLNRFQSWPDTFTPSTAA
jgi:tRNA-dihydrouridine synthase C